jgi:dynactin-5
MEPLPVYYKSNLYLMTNKGNKISKSVNLRGTAQITIDGKAVMQNGVSIRGDLAPITMKKYVIIRDDVIIRPTYSK